MLGKAAHTLLTMAKVGLLVPGRPDRVLRQLTSLHRWGFGLVGDFTQAARRDPGRAAVVDERCTRTYRELDERSTRLAHALRATTHGRQPKIGVLCRNHAGMIETMLAGGKLGAEIVLLNTGMSAAQLGAVVAEQGVDVLVVDDDLAAGLAEVPDDIPRICAWGSGGGPTLDGLIDEAPATPLPPPASPSRTIILTSGTTGTPKGARRPQPPGLSAAAAVWSRIPLRVGDRVLLASPLFHTWAYGGAQLSFAVRATLVLSRRFDPKRALAALADERCTAMFAVPVLLQRLLELPAGVRRQFDTAALRAVAVSGSTLPGDLATRFMDAFGDVLYNLYGSTEVSWASIATPADMRAAPGTAGKAPYGTKLAILDPAGAEVPAGEVGRIFVGNNMLFDGYTSGASKAVRDGLMSTGDLGHLDANGRLFVDGREDDMIISGGENVFPREVEDLLARQPEVGDVAVVGVPDDDFGQRLAAWVVLRPDAKLTEDEVRALVRERLARHCVPRDVHFVAELPRNATGKVVTRSLHSDGVHPRERDH